MRFRIHFEWPDGTADSVVVSGDAIEETQQAAQREVAQRGGQNPWSEEIE